MTIIEKYEAKEAAIASYSYTDIADGTGIVKFYLMDSETSAGADYNLTTDSAVKSRTGNIATSAATDLDFDLTSFKLPRIVEGAGLINLSVRLNAASSFAFVVKIRHWDGSTETDLVSVTSDTHTSGGGAENFWFTVPFTVPSTKFKKGDILRVTIEGDTATGSGVWFHDPANRDLLGAGNSTNTFVNIPFAINV